MACSCKCCCGCCCDGETGEQKLERQCTSPKEFQGKGTSCDVCCDLGEIREDITEESECPGTWVVNGRCQDAPCDPCQPCDDCSWPASRNEGVECFITPCCYFPYSNVNSRDQTFSSTLPPGISWKTGYPDALDLCNWRWCADSVNAQCYDSNANACRVITKTRYKLLALDCDTESAVDLTSTAATGTFETTSSGACTSGPDFPSYFDDPVPVCPP
jgi:hypothetical protein